MLLRQIYEDILYVVIVPKRTEERLAWTCFRGRETECAGNFCRWESANELFRDRIVLRHVLKHLQTAPAGTSRLDIEYPTWVGWSSTDQRRRYGDAALEQFNLNQKAVALRVREDAKFLAPLTKRLTIAYERRDEPNHAALIHSIYPGRDIGLLRGDVTAREGCVFFGWEHPGEPIPEHRPHSAEPRQPGKVLSAEPASVYRPPAVQSRPRS